MLSIGRTITRIDEKGFELEIMQISLYALTSAKYCPKYEKTLNIKAKRDNASETEKINLNCFLFKSINNCALRQFFILSPDFLPCISKEGF